MDKWSKAAKSQFWICEGFLSEGEATDGNISARNDVAKISEFDRPTLCVLIRIEAQKPNIQCPASWIDEREQVCDSLKHLRNTSSSVRGGIGELNVPMIVVPRAFVFLDDVLNDMSIGER